MSDKIEPALTAEEWTARAIRRDQNHYAEELTVDVIGGLTVGSSYTGDEGGRVHDRATVEPQNIPAIIALTNDALSDSDPRKIKGLWTRWLREEADVLRRNGAGAGALMADEIAAALETYLPPE